MSPASLSSYFAGSWRISRRIGDLRAGETGWLSGTARFDAVPDGLRYDEAGEMRLGAHRGPASQSYLFVLKGGALAEVLYADGRPFHALDLTDGTDTVAHQCGDDLYRGRYRVLSNDCWWLAWKVTGPRKDYLMATRYLRISVDRHRRA